MIESLNTSQQNLEAKVAQKADELRSAHVITSYSIHYTKLYEAWRCHGMNVPLYEKIWMWAAGGMIVAFILMVFAGVAFRAGAGAQ